MSHNGPPADSNEEELSFPVIDESLMDAPASLAEVQSAGVPQATIEQQINNFDTTEPMEGAVPGAPADVAAEQFTRPELYQAMISGTDPVHAGEVATAEQTVDIELPLGETAPAQIEVLRSSSETERNEENAGLDAFKAGVQQRFGGVLSRAGALWSRVKGATANAAWMGAYGAYKAPQVVAEGAVAGYNAVADAGERAGDRIVAGVEGAIDSGKAFVADAKEVTMEVGGAIKETAVEMGKDVASAGRAVAGGLETAGMVALGAGVLAVEGVGKGINATVELGVRGIAAGEKFIQSSLETANQKKEQAIQKMAQMKAVTLAAAASVANAAEAKTMEVVNKSKEMIASGINSVAETGKALKESAESSVRSAWEKFKNKGNLLKRGLIMAKVGYHESKGQRISDKAQMSFAKANKARAGLAALTTTV